MEPDCPQNWCDPCFPAPAHELWKNEWKRHSGSMPLDLCMVLWWQVMVVCSLLGIIAKWASLVIAATRCALPLTSRVGVSFMRCKVRAHAVTRMNSTIQGCISFEASVAVLNILEDLGIQIFHLKSCNQHETITHLKTFTDIVLCVYLSLLPLCEW